MRILIFLCLICGLFGFGCGQEAVELIPDQTFTFSLRMGEEKNFVLSLKEGDYVEIFLSGRQKEVEIGESDFNCVVYDPSRKSLEENLRLLMPENWINSNCQNYFVALSTGKYLVSVKLSADSFLREKLNPKIDCEVSVKYSNDLRLPSEIDSQYVRKIGDYTVRTIIGHDTEGIWRSLFLLEKEGKLRFVLQSDVLFYLAEDLRHAYRKEEKKSAMLVRRTLDKTGDGLPDIMLVTYSLGAHCCFETFFFELGEKPFLREYIYTGNAGLIAVKRNPKGGLIFKTWDDGFVYWFVSFADSPAPEVILEFVNGKLQPNLELMRKPAPSQAVLMRRAIRAKLDIVKAMVEAKRSGNEPRSCKDLFELFPEKRGVFWGEMLNLLYSGHDELAWKYFDIIWLGLRRDCKERFRKAFLEQLSESRFWRMILERRKRVKNSF